MPVDDDAGLAYKYSNDIRNSCTLLQSICNEHDEARRVKCEENVSSSGH
jgi:hypothetical protein